MKPQLNLLTPKIKIISLNRVFYLIEKRLEIVNFCRKLAYKKSLLFVVPTVHWHKACFCRHFRNKAKNKTDLCQFILILSASLWPYNILHTGPWAESFFKLGEIFENFRLLLFGQAVQGVLVDNASAFILALTLLELGEVNC